MAKSFLGATFLLLLAIATASADTGHEEAKQHFLRGVDLFGKRDLPGALAEFEASYQLNPVPEVLFNVALTQRALGRKVEALASFDRVLTEARERKAPLNAKRQAEGERAIAELKTQLGSLLLAVSPPNANVLIDGKPPREGANLTYLEPGQHRVEIASPGYSSMSQDLTIVPGKSASLSVSLNKDQAVPPVVVLQTVPAPVVATKPSFLSTRRGKATVALAALTGATFITVGILGGLALADRSDYRASCEPTGVCDRNLYDRGHALALSTDVLIGVGAGLAAATLLTGLIKAKPRTMAVAPVIGGKLAGLSVQGAF